MDEPLHIFPKISEIGVEPFTSYRDDFMFTKLKINL